MDMSEKTPYEKISFQKIAIVYNEDVRESLTTAKLLQEELCTNNLSSTVIPSDKKIDADFVITVGGDGTLLKAARLYPETPVFGINLGRLGFLAQAKPAEIKTAVKKLINGEYTVQKRMMLEASGEKATALNDIVIKGDSFSRTSRLYLSINGKPVCDYLADGIIIATPTGSTAYTLSAGGPVIYPGMEAIVIVPICPHTLTARPLVVPSNEKIEISSCESCTGMKLSADGQKTIDIRQNQTVTIEKSRKTAKLVVLKRENNGFYSVLREKLQWGVAPRA